MNRYIYLVKNIGILTLSSFATKLLSFFLVPLYTSVLSTIDYGTYDLIQTTVGILLPILTLNIQEAVLRFALDKKYCREAVITIAMRYLLVSCVIFILGVFVNYLFCFSEIIKQYSVFFFLIFFVQALSGIIVSYIRGIDKILELSISSFIAAVVTIACNILFLVVFKWGLMGYFCANIIGPLVQSVYLMICSHVIRDTHLRQRYSIENDEMVHYCKPLIANSIAWWVNNASDRYVVILFCGLAENGIYSVASKIPSILNIFQTIFNQAWTISAVKEFDPEDKNGFFSNTYKAYNCMMVLACSAIIVLDKMLAFFLYASDFYVAWKYVPWLTIAIVFGSLSGYIGGFFAAVKNSSIFARSSMIGAMVNIVLNIMFTPIFGALGAAIATTICYFVVWLVRLKHSSSFIKIRINISRDLITYILLVFQAIALLKVLNNVYLYTIEIVIFLGIIFLYKEDIMIFINRMKK